MKRKILPTGRQSFRSLREDNCIYVDKTQHIYRLCTQEKMYFLSRPRRFGKSLLLSTLNELFLGSQDLFTDTWIADNWDWTKKNPVIHISFLSVPYTTMGLETGIRYYLLELCEEHHINNKGIEDISLLFTHLIKELYKQGGQVVILIDEYDKPIIDHLEFHAIDKAKANQAVLGLFYGALKDLDIYIRMLFITGVSKFTKVSLFSKLNNLLDLTLHPSYATMLGYTQEELESNFDGYIDDVLTVFPEYSRESLLAEVKLWYNGYSWDGKVTLYNPFGILLFLSGRDFQSYWFSTGTPTFLVKKLEQQNFFQLENIEADFNFLDQYSLDNIEITSLLFQTGYLTIKEKSKFGELVLSYPNKEVRMAMYTFLIDDMGHTTGGGGVTVRHLRKAFMEHDLDRVENILSSLFSGLTYDVYNHQTPTQIEGFYHGLIHILFKCLGIYIQSEVHTAKGRADCVVETPTHIYILEFKINSTAQIAFQQILDRKYAASYKADTRTKIGIGINFNSANRDLDGWQSEEI
jgi:Predicted AAA-ATPase/PD-(D/E)XK nuclease superfamily